MKHAGVMTFTVGWGDCSPSGAVFYPNYFRWFDAAMWNFFDQADWPLRAMEAEHGNVGLPLIETHVNFKRPCRLHDLLRLETSITAFARKTLDMSHTLFNGDKIAIEASDIRFWGVKHPDGSGRLKAALIPEKVVTYFSV